MALIKLTEKFTGDIILIDPETITKVENTPMGTFVVQLYGADIDLVRETPQQILNIIEL
jgi:hypothetical protein